MRAQGVPGRVSDVDDAAQPRFAKNYAVNVALVALTLFPGLIDTEALPLLLDTMARDLHATPQVVQWAGLLGDCALAFGVIVSAALLRRAEQRSVYLCLLVAACVGALLRGFAPNVWLLLAGSVVQEAATGMLFIVALPPLVTSFSAAELRITVGVLVGALFGAATLGPPIGGLTAAPDAWRWIFFGEAAVALAAFVLALVTLPKRAPMAPGDPPDRSALGLTAGGTLALFAGAGFLGTGGIAGAAAPWLMAAGICAYLALLLVEREKEQPLLPVRSLETAFPLMGAIGTIAGNAIYGISNAALTHHLLLVQARSPLAAGMTLAPAVAAAALAGFIFSRTLPTKYVVFNAIAGFALFALSALGGAWLAREGSALGVAAVAFGFALASGLTVTPGLFIAGLSVKRDLVGRAIAVLELYRLAAGYASSPVYNRFLTGATLRRFPAGRAPDPKAFAHYLLTGTVPGNVPALSLQTALLATLHQGFYALAGLSALAGVALVAVLAFSPARLHAPDLKRFVNEGEPALESPHLTAA